ncbi:hypothetical protein TW95_gp0565 [Pandoravirus inopinatum]|uniref:Uncharacterized protein n=1 Tax=Pandoravirus inopinatum TaxID=1605721 RepID=A0A0B5J1D8_9VIRU|nr:hypothetical protein TW95_gp0565 [Pandoravirus inopinatum]AJF97299.1 hypothetical protein [Pandoravirus inopinatum]
MLFFPFKKPFFSLFLCYGPFLQNKRQNLCRLLSPPIGGLSFFFSIRIPVLCLASPHGPALSATPGDAKKAQHTMPPHYAIGTIPKGSFFANRHRKACSAAPASLRGLRAWAKTKKRKHLQPDPSIFSFACETKEKKRKIMAFRAFPRLVLPCACGVCLFLE